MTHHTTPNAALNRIEMIDRAADRLRAAAVYENLAEHGQQDWREWYADNAAQCRREARELQAALDAYLPSSGETKGAETKRATASTRPKIRAAAGNALAQARTRKGLRQAHVALHLGVTLNHYALVEIGRRKPSKDLAERILSAFPLTDEERVSVQARWRAA